jgi:sulfite reductase (NADPH) flavoprotein alpha-component
MLSDAGADRVIERVDCDADFEVSFSQFKTHVVSYLNETSELWPKVADETSAKSSRKSGGLGALIGRIFGFRKAASVDVASPPASNPDATSAVKAEEDHEQRDQPKVGRLNESRLLSRTGSAKETRHYSITVEDQEFSYHAGDCIGVYPQNCGDEVAELLELLQLEPSQSVSFRNESFQLGNLLRTRLCLQRTTLQLLNLLAPFSTQLKTLLSEGGATLEGWLRDHHVVDVVQSTDSPKVSAQELVGVLRSLQPRLYSIASSPLVQPQVVDLTVETIRFNRHGREVKGVASTWLADRMTNGEAVPVYLHEAPHFRLVEPNHNILMIGAGTGVAPYRAFLQERHASKASGRSWLIFGHQHEDKDFLYQEELQEWQRAGTLTELSCAWSRDQAEKVYVQDLLHQQQELVWDYLSSGATIYVCGDASKMAPAVHDALAAIGEAHGIADGKAWLIELENQGRYRRDVY